MAKAYQSYLAFISSPGDVSKERQIAEEVIETTSKRLSQSLQLHILPWKWENRPPAMPAGEVTFQDEINKRIDECHFFVLILGKRYGSKEPGHKKGNVEREVERALAKHRSDPSFGVLAYFKELPANNDRGRQERDLRAFQKRLKAEGIVFHSFRSDKDFKERFTHDLYEVAIKKRYAIPKIENLRRFWQLGSTGQRTGPRVDILYPPVERSRDHSGADPSFWLRRLATQVYFEDYKAVDKVTKTLSLIGFKDWHVHAANDPPVELSNSNRVWVCVPRIKHALQRLEHYRERLRFRFDMNEGRPANLVWSLAGKEIMVQSPLSSYLMRQRSSMNTGGEWQPEFGRIAAKDFAILGRMTDGSHHESQDEEPLRDYFLVGIRGLGTWGAGWFIDRRSGQLTRYGDHEDIQLLLEVRYADNRIVDVINVSEQPQEYFHREIESETIDRYIADRGLTLKGTPDY